MPKELQIDATKVNTGEGDATVGTFALNEDLHESVHFEGVNTVSDMATRMNELSGQVSDYKANAPVIPENIEGYSMEFPEGSNPDLTNGFLEVAHKQGLTNEQAKAFLQFNQERVTIQQADAIKSRKEADEKAVSDTENGLKDLWKENYEANMNKGMKVLKKFGDEDFFKELNTSGRGNSIHFAKFLHALHGVMGEDVFIGGPSAQPKGKMPITGDGRPKLVFPSMAKQT